MAAQILAGGGVGETDERDESAAHLAASSRPRAAQGGCKI
jgi:hypothetical protein